MPQWVHKARTGFAPMPLIKLPFPTTSSNDPYASLDRARFSSRSGGGAAS